MTKILVCQPHEKEFAIRNFINSTNAKISEVWSKIYDRYSIIIFIFYEI